MSNSRTAARMPIGYIRDRTAVYREKWDALHPKCVRDVGCKLRGVCNRVALAGTERELLCRSDVHNTQASVQLDIRMLRAEHWVPVWHLLHVHESFTFTHT